MKNGYYLYLLFTISWFVHLSSRIPFLGMIRFDMILVILMWVSILTSKKTIKETSVNNNIKLLLIYIILTLPFVEWPGSVARFGLEKIIKATMFYYFTVYFVDTEDKLKRFIQVFLICQSFRIFEPVYLHITEGYWGSVASMSGWEYMERLSGAPKDTINPNGLAFVILTVIPFLYYLFNTSTFYRLFSLITMPVAFYALLLTGSRSGMIGLIIIFTIIVIKSKNKLVISSIIIAVALFAFGTLSDVQKDRYLSIVSSDTRNATTAEGRTQGVISDFSVALRRPLFGHGLGTSREANANFGGKDQMSHNLYTEVAQELGFVGLLIFLFFIRSIVINYFNKESKPTNSGHIVAINNGILVFIITNILFSFASYGLTSYEWYLFAGLSVSVDRLKMEIS